MNESKKLITVVCITLVASLAIGIAIGTSLKNKGMPFSGNSDDNNNAVPVPIKDVNWNDKSQEELGSSLSEVMLPEDEFTNLQKAIFQTAMGLFTAQAQSAGINVSDESQQELKKTIEDRYSRKYFSDLNADSMKDLSKPELITILSFYNTEAGVKFLKLSPKMVNATMHTLQQDLSSWVPTAVDAQMAKLKGGTGSKNPSEQPKVEPQNLGQDVKDEKADS
ncbi:MAG TPA: DUF2059 domain-containing protein [Myxococcota bacterium]|nr:DUF2059 domain-containing protein [Myxococcota bacterium]